jgi:hypothetical protein
VLERVEPEISELGGFGMPEDRKHSAIVVELVIRDGIARDEIGGWVQRVLSANQSGRYRPWLLRLQPL